MPVSSLKWTRAVVLALRAAAEMSFAVARSVTGSITPAFTIGAISSGRIEESICTSAAHLPRRRTDRSSSASNGSATPKSRQPAFASASAYGPTPSP